MFLRTVSIPHAAGTSPKSRAWGSYRGGPARARYHGRAGRSTDAADTSRRRVPALLASVILSSRIARGQHEPKAGHGFALAKLNPRGAGRGCHGGAVRAHYL